MSLPVYTQGFGTAFTGATVVAPFAPSTSNIQGPNGPFKIGQTWIDSSTEEGYILTALTASAGSISAVWQQFSSASGILDTLTGNSGVATAIAGNINVTGLGGLITTTGSAGSLTIASTLGAYPISPFVVGPLGEAGYQTVQSAINAANAAGGGSVYIQPGVYNENLTIYTGVNLIGTNVNVAFTNPVTTYQITINGNHTVAVGMSALPMGFDSINFVSTVDMFSTSAAISVGILINNCNMRASSHYIISIPNLTITTNSYFVIQNCTIFDGGTINTNAGISMNILDSNLALNGVTPTQVIGAGSSWNLNNVNNSAPINVSSGTLQAFGCFFADTITSAAASVVSMNGSYIFTDIDPSFVVNGTSSIQLYNCQISSSATHAIDGTSSGTNFLNSIVYLSNATVNPALTIINPSTILLGAGLIGTTVPIATSIFTIASTTQGFLTPRMTTTQKDAIVSPGEGLVVYDLTLHQLSYFNGTIWTNI